MKRIVIVTGLLVGILATVSDAALPPFNASRLYSEAAFMAAIKPYAEAVSKNANDADGHYWLGVAYVHGARMFRFGLAPYAEGYGAKAIASLERAIQLRPASVRAYVALMEAYSVAGDRDGSKRTVDRLVKAGLPEPLALPK